MPAQAHLVAQAEAINIERLLAALSRAGVSASVSLEEAGASFGELVNRLTAALTAPQPASALDSPTDTELRALWRKNGGTFYGPRVETGDMPEARLLPFLRSLAQHRGPDALPTL